jgi:hypothetical protein
MLGALLFLGGLLLIAYGANMLPLTIASPTVIVVDRKTGQILPNALVIIHSSVYAGDGRLYWISWGGGTAKISAPGSFYIAAVAEVGDNEGHIYPYSGSVYVSEYVSGTIKVRVERLYGGVPWWYADAKNGNLTVKCDDKIMSGLSASQVQSLIEQGHVVYLWALLNIKVDSTICGYTSPYGIQTCRWLSTVKVTAIPYQGHQFYGWVLDGSVRTENPITVYMDRNHMLKAYFLNPLPPPTQPLLPEMNPNPPYQQPTEQERTQTQPNATSTNTATLPTGAPEVKPEIRTEYVLFGAVLCIAGVWIAVKKPSAILK